MSRVIYVAGPYRGANAWAIEQNVRVAEGIALEVWRMGAAAICPHTLARFYQGAYPDEAALILDMALLARCDAIIMTPGWERSVGASAEKAQAERMGLPVFEGIEALGALARWLNNGAPGNLVERWADECASHLEAKGVLDGPPPATPLSRVGAARRLAAKWLRQSLDTLVLS